jgi:peptidoglycan L-alanyl-D-glutamate endopeptidase CwlK
VVKEMAAHHIVACMKAGIDLLVTCTFRDRAEQAELYALGRTVPGKKVTNAKAGQSMHNYGLAYDVVPMRLGKPVWGTTGADLLLWQKVGELGKEAGLEWAGEWVGFKEFPHFQFTNGHPIAFFQGGGKL